MVFPETDSVVNSVAGGLKKPAAMEMLQVAAVYARARRAVRSCLFMELVPF